MPTLYLTEADVERLIDMPTAIAVVDAEFSRMEGGQVHNVPRERAVGRGFMLHTMSAIDGGLRFACWKAYTTTKHGARFLVGLYDAETGRLEALIEADQLGQLRTGATTGVAVSRLTYDDVDRVGLFGTGTQARTQLAAVAAVRSIKKAVVYGRNEDRRRDFAKSMSAQLQIDVIPADSPADAVRGLPIVVTATTSRTPVFSGDDVWPGTTVCAVGSNWLDKAEIDAGLIGRASFVVCDDVAACRKEAGDLHAAKEAGTFDWSKALSLSNSFLANQARRTSRQEIIVFKSVGLAAEDLALGVELFRRARAAGVGSMLPIGDD